MTATAPSEPVAGRRLGLFERWMVSKANIGCPSTIAFVAAFPVAASDRVTPSRLKQAISHLGRLHPLTRCGISGGRTRTPSFALSPAIDPDAVLDVINDTDLTEAGLLKQLVNCGRTFSGFCGPLWRVTLCEGADHAGPLVGLAVSHAISDGVGARNLFQHLLRLLYPLNQLESGGVQELEEALPPSFEDSVGATLDWRAVGRLVLDKLVWPKLSALLWAERYLVPTSAKNDGQSVGVALIRISAESVARLKAVAWEHTIATLHPLLQGSILAAVFLAYNNDSSHPNTQSGSVRSLTPISQRDPKKGHPASTGCYLSALHATHSLTPQTPLLALCRSYAATLASPGNRLASIHLMLALQLLPDPEPVPLAELEPGKTYPATGWDLHLLDFREGRRTPEGDLTVSNLGVMDNTGWEGEEGFSVAWAQAVNCYENPLCVNLVSLRGGAMSVAVSWVEGTLDQGGFAEHFVRELEQVLAKVAEGSVGEGTTLEELRR